jgi:hypothetical protein
MSRAYRSRSGLDLRLGGRHAAGRGRGGGRLGVQGGGRRHGVLGLGVQRRRDRDRGRGGHRGVRLRRVGGLREQLFVVS